MSVAATGGRRRDEERRGELTLSDRLLAAVPLASVYVWLSIVYMVEAWKRITPWLFTDELEMTQLQRSIAATGHAARRGEPHSFRSLYNVLAAPIWWIDDVAAAYSTLKYVDVLMMTAVVFPTYFLARMVVGRRWALFAAAGAAAAPALGYSSWIVEETLAYPYAALCFLLIAKALSVRGPWWIGGAVVASLVAPFVRGEFVVVPIAFAIAVLLMLWSSEPARRRRATWTVGDYVGVVALVVGVIVVISAFAGWHNQQWLEVTSYNWTKHRALVYGDWAAGALAIGLGVLPFAFGLAALVPRRSEERDLGVRVFRCVATAGVVVFGLYTGMKAGYLSMHFETRIEERNLIYIGPLLFVGTAFVLERRRVNLVALAAATAYTLYLLAGTPFRMDVQLYSDALGLAILQQANRFYEWTPATAQWLLIAILLGGVVLVAALRVRRLPAVAAGAVAAVLAVGVLAWNVTAQIAAGAGNVSISRELEQTLRHPFTWVDDVAAGKPTLYLGQGVADQNPEWLLEFWNRSITTVSSLDGTIGGPGPAGAPNITARGQLYWTADARDPGKIFDYAVEDWPCVDFAGTTAAIHRYRGGADRPRQWRLVRLTKPNRLRATCSGIYPDGWSGANDTTYFRFGGSPGWLRIRLSRENWPATKAHVVVGGIGVQHRTPVIDNGRSRPSFLLRSTETKTVWVRVPHGGVGVQVVVESKFVPREVNPDYTDPRQLGAQVDFRFYTKRPR